MVLGEERGAARGAMAGALGRLGVSPREAKYVCFEAAI